MERKTLFTGAVAGVVASVVMGMFAMIAAATYQDTGFFTPLYHIASPIIGTDTLMESMGSTYLSIGPALLGLAIHMMVGAMWGVLFAVVARSLRVTGPSAVGLGVGYGIAVMFVMAFVGLPVTAAVLQGGDMVSDMASMVGWLTFTAEHAMYGLVLGAGYAVATRSEPVSDATATARATA